MSWLWLVVYFAIGYAVMLPMWWPHREHPLMRGVGFVAIWTLSAVVWPLLWLHRALAWAAEHLDRD